MITPILKTPTKFQLYQNYPNPFNPATNIRFDIPPRIGGGIVDISLLIYDSLGQLTKTLYKDILSSGSYEIRWDGTTDLGNNAPSGTYFVAFRANDFSQTGKLVLVK
jgi:hypothetical protein